MRKIIVLTFISLDGVMQAPGGPDEDRSGGFEYGGWIAPFNDDGFAEIMKEDMRSSDLLLGRKTFEIWENYWPQHAESWPGVNDVTKYVVSTTKKGTDWKNSVFLENVTDIKKLKGSTGSNLQVWGSSGLVQSLLENDLIDELRLKIFPLTLGKGKKLFGNGTMPAAFKMIESTITPTGIIAANYQRAGEVKTGSMV
jgi:dihydrofolate reductase